MKTTIQEKEGVITAILDGELDTAATAAAQEDFKPLFDAENKKIVLDCHALKYISSSGLRLFLSLLKQSKVRGNSLSIEGMNSEVKNVFKLTGFDKLFAIS